MEYDERATLNFIIGGGRYRVEGREKTYRHQRVSLNRSSQVRRQGRYMPADSRAPCVLLFSAMMRDSWKGNGSHLIVVIPSSRDPH